MKMTKKQEHRIAVIISQMRILQGGGSLEYATIETSIEWLKELGD